MTGAIEPSMGAVAAPAVLSSNTKKHSYKGRGSSPDRRTGTALENKLSIEQREEDEEET